MKLTSRQRWAVYGIALVLTLGAVVWVERASDESTPVAVAPEKPDTAEQARTTEESRKRSALGIDGLPTRTHENANGDPFSPRSWEQMAAEEARRDQPPPRPVVPQPPPMPFTYMGKLIEGKETRVFLTRGEQHFIVRQGDTLEHRYRVEEIGENGMVLTYLPLKRKQQLSFASAGDDARSGRARPARYDEANDAVDTHDSPEEADPAWQSGGQISRNNPEQDEN